MQRELVREISFTQPIWPQSGFTAAETQEVHTSEEIALEELLNGTSSNTPAQMNLTASNQLKGLLEFTEKQPSQMQEMQSIKLALSWDPDHDLYILGHS